MITQTSLRSLTVQARIYAAMRLCVKAALSEADCPLVFNSTCTIQATRKGKGFATAYVPNRKGNNFLRVDYTYGKGFRFYAAADAQTRRGIDCTDVVLASLQSPDEW